MFFGWAFLLTRKPADNTAKTRERKTVNITWVKKIEIEVWFLVSVFGLMIASLFWLMVDLTSPAGLPIPTGIVLIGSFFVVLWYWFCYFGGALTQLHQKIRGVVIVEFVGTALYVGHILMNLNLSTRWLFLISTLYIVGGILVFWLGTIRQRRLMALTKGEV